MASRPDGKTRPRLTVAGLPTVFTFRGHSDSAAPLLCSEESCACATPHIATSEESRQEQPASPHGHVRRMTPTRVSVASLSQSEEAASHIREAVASEAAGGAKVGERISTGLTYNEAVANFVIACVGAGICVFPRVMGDVGYMVSPIVMITAAVCLCECGMLILRSCDLAEKLTETPPGSIKTYEAVAEAALGRKGRAALMVTKNLYMLGVIIAYVCLETDDIGVWIPIGASKVRWFIVAPVFIALAMLKDLKAVARLSVLGIFAAFVQCGAIAYGCAYVGVQGVRPLPTYEANRGTFDSIGASLAISVFGFGSIATGPSLRSQMAKPEELPSAMRFAFCIVVSLYLIVMALGYWGFGQSVRDNIIDSMTSSSSSLVSSLGELSALSIIVNLLISMPTFSFCVVSVIEASGDDAVRTPLTVPNIALRATLMTSMVLISSCVPYVKQVINLISAIFGSWNSLFFPLLFFYALRRRVTAAKQQSAQLYSIPSERAVKKDNAWWPVHICLLALGFFVIVFGTRGALAEFAAAASSSLA